MNIHHFEIMEQDGISTDTTSDVVQMDICSFRYNIELLKAHYYGT